MDLTNYTDASEFIDNNLVAHFDVEGTFSPGAAIIVHNYGEGRSLSSPLYPEFLLDDIVPFRGVIAKYQRNKQLIDASVDPCDTSYKINNWQRAGCNYGDFDLGYNGEIFWRLADSIGTAKWIPVLPLDGRYRVSIFIPADSAYSNGLSSYQLSTSLNGIVDAFTIDQFNYHLLRGGIDVTSTDTIEKLYQPGLDGTQYGAWITVGSYNFTAGQNASLRLVGAVSHLGQVGQKIAADAVRFVYIGQ